MTSIARLLLQTAYHSIALAVVAHYLNFSQTVFQNDATVGGQFKFLTQLNHISQGLFFLFSIFNDLRLLVGGKNAPKPSPVQKFIDSMFVLLFCVASMVGILFWSIFFYDRELILPAAVEQFYPRELNLFQHGWTAVLMWIEGLLVNHHYYELLPHVINLLFVTVSYGLWTIYLKSQNGVSICLIHPSIHPSIHYLSINRMTRFLTQSIKGVAISLPRPTDSCCSRSLLSVCGSNSDHCHVLRQARLPARLGQRYPRSSFHCKQEATKATATKATAATTKQKEEATISQERSVDSQPMVVRSNLQD
eukprot:TRINITY_DN3673_c0_g1_i2.p1 TRINITY_DN3673_c0_g1~~TRINITY_DN3673_c0_g1_i2.p1  ORF type:complete len:306 (-),score=41.53 TRINITY_DN3673_c0_g1_i2:21-938(-)